MAAEKRSREVPFMAVTLSGLRSGVNFCHARIAAAPEPGNAERSAGSGGTRPPRMNFPLFQLPDGAPVLLRPVTPADEPLVVEAFRRLSPESRYYRFWSHYPEIPAEMAKRLADPDGGNHVAWTAQIPELPNDPGYGAGSYWRSRTAPDEAELSFTIADEAQHRGVGTLLLAVLWTIGTARGVKVFTGFALPDNYAVHDWFRALGADVRWDGGQFSILLPLDISRLPDTSAAAALRERLAEVEDPLRRVMA